MNVPDWMYVLTDLVLPLVAAMVVVASVIRAGDGATLGAGLIRARRVAGIALVGSGAVHGFELMQSAGELSGVGWLLVGGTLAAQLGLGLVLLVGARRRAARSKRGVELALGTLVLAGALAMVLVAAQVLWPFG